MDEITKEELMLWHDGNLPPERAKFVEVMLRRNPQLRSELEQLRALEALLLAAKHAPDAGSATRVALMLARRHSRIRWQRAAAAAVLVLAGTLWVLWPADDAAPPAPEPADYSVLLHETDSDPLRRTLIEIEWVQSTWLPRG